MSAPDINPLVRCPRCGYDQRGVVATWTDACPLEGTCTECGLRITWSEVLQPEKFEPQWCVEFVPRMRWVARACVKTYIRSFWPWRFCSQLKMSHAIRWGRLLCYIAALLLSLIICYLPVQGGVAIYVRYQFQQILAQQMAQIPQTIRNMQNSMQAAATITSTDPQAAAQQQQTIIMMQSQIVRLQQMSASPPTINISYLQAISEGVFSPFGSYSNGTYTAPFGTLPYVPPGSLWDFAINARSYASGGASGRTFEPPIAAMLIGFCFGLTMMAFLPASLILLPVSRRKAKVRWAHIARVVAYSLFVPHGVVFMSAAWLLVGLLVDAWAGPIRTLLILITCAGPPIAMFLWWGAAISRYMKIPHGHFTVFVLMILCALLIVAGIWFMVPGMLINS